MGWKRKKKGEMRNGQRRSELTFSFVSLGFFSSCPFYLTFFPPRTFVTAISRLFGAAPQIIVPALRSSFRLRECALLRIVLVGPQPNRCRPRPRPTFGPWVLLFFILRFVDEFSPSRVCFFSARSARGRNFSIRKLLEIGDRAFHAHHVTDCWK